MKISLFSETKKIEFFKNEKKNIFYKMEAIVKGKFGFCGREHNVGQGWGHRRTVRNITWRGRVFVSKALEMISNFQTKN